MTPAEKAKELIRIFTPNSIDDFFSAGDNARLCVDEIIKANPTLNRTGRMINGVENYYKDDNINYWEQVKEELQKL